MAARYEVELKVLSASNLKNVNWKHGPLRPYVVVWLDADASAKATTSVAPLADSGPDGADPVWDADDDARAKVVLPVPRHADLDDTALLIEVVHAVNHEDDDGGSKVKPLVGTGRIVLRDVLNEVGIGERTMRSIGLKRPSGRPQGVLDLKICVREPPRSYYYDSHPPPAAAAPYYASSGYPDHASRDASYAYGAPAPPPVGYPYGSAPAAPPPTAGYGGYGYGAPPAGYPAYGGAPAAPPACYPSYGGATGAAPPADKKKSKFGVGTGVAVGAAAGLLGGLALAEGYDHLTENIAEDAAQKVEDDYGGYDDDY